LTTCSHYEQCPNEYPKSEDDLIAGFGLGQLSAAAVSCSNSIVDLTDLAAEAVHLAFLVGVMVGRASISSLQSNETNKSWSIVVPGTAEDVEAAVRTTQVQTVCAKAYEKNLVVEAYVTPEHTSIRKSIHKHDQPDDMHC